MKTGLLATCLASMLLLSFDVAAAQPVTVWRCGADGRSYSTTPCSEGRALEAVASPSVAERQAAQRTAAREIRLAEQLRDQRRRGEAETRHNGLLGLRTSPPGPALTNVSERPRLRPLAAGGTWRAAAPASRRAKG